MFVISMATEHLGSSIKDWGGGPWGKGSSPWSVGQGLHPPEEGPGLSLQQIIVLAVGLGRNGHYLLIVFGTYCVILEERKGIYQPLIEI